MIDCKKYYDFLKEEEVNFFTGVPDSLLKNFISYISEVNKDNHIIGTNEGSSIGMGIGYHLATNKIPFIYLQNSGLGNIINPLLSLADKEVYAIPMIIMVGWRGEPGIKDEPQHIKQGRVTLELIKSMGFDTKSFLMNLIMQDQTKNLITKAKIENKPVFLVVKKNTFSFFDSRKKEIDNLLNREEAIKTISLKTSKNDLVISTTGKSSRELFETRNSQNKKNDDFLTVGGMGHANQIALGISLFKKEKKVYCIDGDGAILMHMGGLVQIANSRDINFCHIIINNFSHESVGGQPTLGDTFSFSSVCEKIGYTETFKVDKIIELEENLDLFKKKGGVFCIEVICSSTSRKNLSRPSLSPEQNKLSFKRKISGY